MSEMKEFKGVDCTIEGERCYVVFVDPEEGITIHRYKNDSEIFCLNKNDAIQYFDKKYEKEVIECYNFFFEETLKGIKKGIVYHVGFGYSDQSPKREIYRNGHPDFIHSPMKCAYK